MVCTTDDPRESFSVGQLPQARRYYDDDDYVVVKDVVHTAIRDAVGQAFIDKVKRYERITPKGSEMSTAVKL
jgi:hypothetical protein